MQSTAILFTLLAYMAALAAIGLWSSRRIKSEGDFFLAGRGLGAVSAGLSYAASTSSAWVLLGFTGMVYTQGMVALWLVPGIFAGYVLTWLVIGPRLNLDAAKHGHITILDFLGQDVAPIWARRIALAGALMILFCFVFYMSSQIDAAGKALMNTFGLSRAGAILIGAGAILLYCLLGGFIAASITNAVQAVVMMAACIIVPYLTVQAAGGIGPMIGALHETQAARYFSITGSAAGFAGAGLALGLLGTGLGALGQPQLLNWIMAVRDPKMRRQGAAITIGWGVVTYTGLILMAMAARSMSIETPKEELFFTLAQQFLPTILAGIVIAAVLSAVMSTVDSLLLSAAAAVSHDIGGASVPAHKAVLYGRIAMIGVAITAVLLTLYAPQDIFKRVLFSWVALGAAFGPSILTKCLGWRLSGGAIFAAILVGFFTAVIAYNAAQMTGGDMRPALGIIEKWGSWIAGLFILTMAKLKQDSYSKPA